MVRIPCTPNKVSEFGEAGQRFSKLRALEARGGCVRTGMQVPSLEFLSLGVRLRDCLPTVPSVADPGPLWTSTEGNVEGSRGSLQTADIEWHV